MADAIIRNDYIESIFIQNFIVEGLNISLLQELTHHTDSTLSELSGKILADEYGHRDFGVEEIKRILEEEKENKMLRKKLIRVQRNVLFYGTWLALTLAKEAKYLGIPASEFGKKAVEEHYERVLYVKLPLPLIDRGLFLLVRFIFSVL